jgi:cytochrome c oxidase subunit II
MTEWFANHILGMPELASKNGEAVDALIVYVHWLMIALFIGWVVYFGYAVWRFRASRNPKADYQGVRNHASSYLELTVAAIEAVLLIGIAIPVWAKAVDHFPDVKDATVIYVMGQQYAWNIRYAGPDGVFGRQDMKFVSSDNVFGVDPADPFGKDDIQTLNEIHVPVGKPVIVYVSSKDVIHSFKVTAMRTCQDAIPGLRIPCAQLCGPGHSSMTGGFLIVESQADFNKWIASKSASSASFE